MSIQIQKVTDASFKKYGRVLTGEYDVDALIEKMQEMPYPDDEVVMCHRKAHWRHCR